MTTRTSIQALFVLALALATIAGCGDDDDPVVPGTGAVEIAITPSGLEAHWTLTGPGGYLYRGFGDLLLADLETGDYTVLWSDTLGWIAPEYAWGELDGGETLQLAGTYVQQGTIAIGVLPGYIDAGWTVTGPDGFSVSGLGTDTLENLDPGAYTMTWEQVVGWQTPDGETGTLEEGGSLAFFGTYLLGPATTADEAMQLFRDVYAGRQYERYGLLLSAAFLFIDQEGGFDDRDEELAIAEKMFHEMAGDGGIVISDITIDLLQPQGVWTNTPINDPYFGAYPTSLYRQYIVDIKFSIAGQYLIYRVQGPVLFYALDEGDGGPDFRLLGMVDATYGNKATENHSWSALRTLFD